METTIKLNSFDITSLNELRNILENNSIKETYNNLKCKDEIKIVYEKKLVELNKKFKFKIELIRNKYYRQFLDRISLIEPQSAYKPYRFNMFLEEIHLSDHIDVNQYRDTIKIALINYIGVFNFDNIFELTKEEMIELKDYICGIGNYNDYTECISKLLGMYGHSSEKVFSILETKISKKKLDEMKKCNKFILICPELIREFCIDHFENFKEFDIKDIFELYNIIFNKVLVHEIGHAVFIDKGESEANYFVSNTFDGVFDPIIKRMTDIQGGEYKYPKLITEIDDFSRIKEIYSI